jgi:hypothetical protein
LSSTRCPSTSIWNAKRIVAAFRSPSSRSCHHSPSSSPFRAPTTLASRNSVRHGHDQRELEPPSPNRTYGRRGERQPRRCGVLPPDVHLLPPPTPDGYAAAFSLDPLRELADLIAAARKAAPERPSISHARAVSSSTRTISPCMTEHYRKHYPGAPST